MNLIDLFEVKINDQKRNIELFEYQFAIEKSPEKQIQINNMIIHERAKYYAFLEIADCLGITDLLAII